MYWNAPGVITSAQPGAVPDNKYLEQYNLGDAVCSQTPQLVSKLLEIKPDAINDPGAGGLRPLHRACARGHAEMVQLLIAHGADLETLSEMDEPPIHYACKRGNPVVIDAMVKAGADVTKLDKLGRSLLHHVAQSGSVYALLYLESALPELRMDQCDYSGRSLMHYACLHGHVEVVRFLLKRSRCPIDLVDDKGNTCMHLLAGSTYDDIAYILVMEAGGFKLLSVKNNEGEVPHAIADKHPRTDSRYIGTRKFFQVTRMVASTDHLSYQGYAICVFLFCFPFCSFAAAILAAKFYLQKWELIIYCATTVVVMLFVRSQTHRTGDSARKPNPIFAGSYAAGIAHSIICFYFDVLPYVRHSWIPQLAILFCPIHLIIYFSLLLCDPGSVSPGEGGEGESFAELVRRGALSRRNGVTPADVYCSSCEFAIPAQWVKHCKLCRRCFTEMDHHCLFLLTCVAKRNHRRFVWLILLSTLGIGIFLYSLYLKFVQVCAREVSLVPLAICVAHRAPWSFGLAVFDGTSFLWGVYMLYSSLYLLSGGVTFYFRGKARPIPFTERVKNVAYFMVVGRVRKQQDNCAMSGHSHGV